MSGIEETILAEGRAEAERILSEAESECEAIRTRSESEIEALYRAQIKRAEEIYHERVRLKVSNAELEGKKFLLKAKRETLDAIYDALLSELENASDKERLKRLESDLKCAKAGEVAFVNAADHVLVEGKWWKAHAPEGVLLSKETLPIRGGVILRGEHADVNLTLEARLASFREESEMELSKQIFGV